MKSGKKPVWCARADVPRPQLSCSTRAGCFSLRCILLRGLCSWCLCKPSNTHEAPPAETPGYFYSGGTDQDKASSSRRRIIRILDDATYSSTVHSVAEARSAFQGLPWGNDCSRELANELLRWLKESELGFQSVGLYRELRLRIWRMERQRQQKSCPEQIDLQLVPCVVVHHKWDAANPHRGELVDYSQGVGHLSLGFPFLFETYD